MGIGFVVACPLESYKNSKEMRGAVSPFVTPKILFGLFKKIIWLEGGVTNFSSKEPSLSKYFLWQEFYLDSPKTCFWSWRFLLFIWTQDKMLFIWGKWLLKISLKMHYGFWIILYHFQQFSLAMALVQIYSPKPSLTFGSCFASNPASCTSPYNYFPFKSYQINFCLLF